LRHFPHKIPSELITVDAFNDQRFVPENLMGGQTKHEFSSKPLPAAGTWPSIKAAFLKGANSTLS
jgi:hypothetical protein